MGTLVSNKKTISEPMSLTKAQRVLFTAARVKLRQFQDKIIMVDGRA